MQFIDQFEQERLKYHTVIQNMECKIQKEKCTAFRVITEEQET
jgi:hypothetical protein